MRDYYKQLYANKMENLIEMDKFLEKHNVPRLNQEGIENINRPVTSTEIETVIKNLPTGNSLMVQWLRIRLPMEGTWVWALVQEDLTCHGAAKPVHCSCWDCALEPMSHSCWACVPQLLRAMCLESVLCNRRGHCSERPAYCSEAWPLLAATRESPRTETKTQHRQK